MKIKQLLFLASATYLLSSCVVSHSGAISSNVLAKPVKYVDMAVGVSQVNRFLGMGGVSKDALILETKRIMIKNRPLKPNEEYANFTLDFKRTFYPFCSQTKVTMCADVVQYTADTLKEVYTDNYKRKILSQFPANELFEIGDSIIYHRNKIGTILSIVSADKVRILYKSKRNTIRTKTMSIASIYTTKKDFKGHTIGGVYKYDIPVNSYKALMSGKIIALGLYSLIIQDNNGKTTELYYGN